MLSARGRVVLALGAFCWFAAVFFGSLALYPVAAGLVLAVPLALAWVRVSVRRPEVRRRWSREDLVEGDDVRVELVLARDSRAPLPDVVTKGFLGLTVTCARCHDHKFDPIPTKDYYSLHGIFASTAEPPIEPVLSSTIPFVPPLAAIKN